jgi:hypothetical protein
MFDIDRKQCNQSLNKFVGSRAKQQSDAMFFKSLSLFNAETSRTNQLSKAQSIERSKESFEQNTD